MNGSRTPVSSHYDGDNDIVVCDDGSVWFYFISLDRSIREWRELKPIPGSRRAVQKAKRQ